MISDGNAGMKKEGLRRHRDTAMGYELRRLGAATRRGDSYGDPYGRRLSEPRARLGRRASRGSALEKQIRSNKGLQATAHKPPLCNGYSSLLRLFLQPVGRRLNPDVGASKK